MNIRSAYRPTSASTAKRPVSGSSSQAKHMPARGAGSSSTCTSDSAVEQQLEALRARMAQLGTSSSYHTAYGCCDMCYTTRRAGNTCSLRTSMHNAM